MKRITGTGCIVTLNGKRNKPYAARITTGWDPKGKQLYKYLGYYATKKEANKALNEYAIGLDRPKQMTVQQAFEGWSNSFQGAKGTVDAYRSAYNKMKSIYNLPLEKLDLDIMQEIANTEPLTHSSANAVKKCFAAMIDYGFAHDACPASRKTLLQYLVVPKRPKADRKPFTPDEIQEAIDKKNIMAVILICTGLRRDELINLDRSDIDLKEQSITVREAKSDAGIRVVPIPDRLVPWIEDFLETGALGHKRRWYEDHLWKPYKTGHVIHEARHTYSTLLESAGVDGRIVSKLMGHSAGVTIDVYTHFTNEYMLNAINPIFDKLLPEIKGNETVYDHLYA